MMSLKLNKHLRRFAIPGRLLSATLLVFSNIFLFASFSVYSGSPEEFEVGYVDMLGSQQWGFALIFLLLLLPGLSSNRGFVNRYVSFVFMLGVLSWLQANFLLWDYGVFDGRATSWDQYNIYGWFDTALWLGLLFASIRFAGHILPFVNFLSWILIVGQAVLMFNVAGNEEGLPDKEHVNARSLPEAFFDMSSKQNIVHFVLDSFQTDVFLQLIEENDLYEDFSGFTLFYDNAGISPHTSFAIPAIFSGQAYDGSESPAAYYKQAIVSGFHNSLFNKGYTVNLIPKMSMRSGKFSNYFEVSSRYQGAVDDLNRRNTAQLIDVALFRSSPHFLRKFLYDGGNWLLLPIFADETSVISFVEKAFLKDYIEGLRVGTGKPAYHFIHIKPPHPPYVTLADGSYAGEILPNTREHYLNESRAVIRLMQLYINKLKSLGVYEDALIILQGDHGSQINPVINGEEIKACLPRLPALLAVKPPGANDVLKVSYSQSSLLDIAPTVLGFAGEETTSIFELDPGLQRQRPFFIVDSKKDITQVSYYSINGSVFDPGSCKKEKQLTVAFEKPGYEYGTKVRFGMTGNADPFLGVGWSPCDADGCWTNGHLAILNLPVEATAADLDLTIRLFPFTRLPNVPRQRIGVSVNGMKLAEWVVTEGQPQNFTLKIPAEQTTGQHLQISFELPDAVKPYLLGLGADKRMLGVAMVSLRLDIAGYEE